ncbi:MAG: hypothetical protein NVSMB59_07650 [Vulcanimicrobiaceae bacterium]
MHARSEHGFTLVDLMVAIAIISVLGLTMGTLGARRSQVHAAGLGLQAALTEARAVALTTGDALDRGTPTGATISIALDPTPPGHGSIIRVYRSRPIAFSVPGAGPPLAALPLVADVGFPTQRVGARFGFNLPSRGTHPIVAPMTILISQSGFTSIIPNYAYDPANARTYVNDPGCDDAGVTVTADDGSPRTETYSFACRDAVLTVDHPVVPHGT